MSATASRVATAYARTREHLAYLGLPTASEHLAAELERAKAEASAPVEVLERLLAVEVEATVARRLSGRLRFAHYPLTKRLVDFELDFQPSIDRAVIAELSTLRFVEERRNALFLGPPGVGKTHIAISLGIAATEAGYRTYFTTATDLVASLSAAHLEGSWSARMRTFTAPSVLVIDELGYLPMDAASAHWIFQVVSPPLRARVDRADQQPWLRRLGPGVRRPGGRIGHPRPSPAPRHGGQHQGRQLPHAGPRLISEGG